MKSVLKIFLLGILLICLFVIPCAADIDPILRDEPNEAVFECKNDIFIEVSEPAVIGKQTAQRTAEENFLYLTVKILYLAEEEMKGLDKASFSLKHVGENGEQVYPLNFAISMISNRMKNYTTMTKTLQLSSYWTLNLVFNVDAADKDNWTLIFTPTERGGSEAYCRIDVPLLVK